MSKQSKKQHRQLPILFIGDGRVEWVGGGADSASICHSMPALSPSPRELATLAAKLVQDAGGKAGRCILMLGGDRTSQKVINLVSMGPKDLGRVLQRKAAGLLGVEASDAWYRAVLLGGNEDQEKRWLICAIRRSELQALTHELERVGFRPIRISSPRLSILSARRQGPDVDEEGHTRTLLQIEPEGASISLLSGGDLVQQSYIPGNFDQPGLMATVLQELRSFEGFWRKLSRGGSVDEVLILGLDEESSRVLTPAIRAALGNAECVVQADAERSTASEARAWALRIAAEQADPRGDLTPKRPPSYLLMVVCAVVAVAVGLDFGIRGEHWIGEEKLEMEQRSSDLWLESRDHDRLQAELTRAQRALEASEKGADRISAVGDAGISLAGTLQAAEQAFEGLATLGSVSVSADGDSHLVILTGTTDSDPGRSLRNLNQVLAALEASANFDAVALVPPRGSLAQSGRESLSFEIRSSLKDQR